LNHLLLAQALVNLSGKDLHVVDGLVLTMKTCLNGLRLSLLLSSNFDRLGLLELWRKIDLKNCSFLPAYILLLNRVEIKHRVGSTTLNATNLLNFEKIQILNDRFIQIKSSVWFDREKPF